MLKLDIGGGKARGDGWTTIDMNTEADIVHDLNIIPWWEIDDSSVDYMLMSHVLEHLNDPFGIMKECFRIAKPGATLEVRVPWWKLDMFSNPFHKHWFKPRWFRILTPDIDIWNNAMDHMMEGMNWKVERQQILRGRLRFWKRYQYTVWLRAIKEKA